jgi:hypothetical protein
MTSKINALSTGVGGIATTADASGILEIQTNDTTAITVNGSQVVSFDNNFGTVAGLPSYQCRAWVNFNGTGTVAIRASGNVSGITDNGTGDYTMNFATAMPDADYSAVGGCIGQSTTGANMVIAAASSASTKTTSALQVTSKTLGGTATDVNSVNVTIFR